MVDITKELTDLNANVQEVLKASNAAQKEQEKFAQDIAIMQKALAEKDASIAQIMGEIKLLREKQGTGTGSQEMQRIKSFFETVHVTLMENIDSFKSRKAREEISFMVKTVGDMTAAVNLTGNVVAQYNNEAAVRGRRITHVRDLVRSMQSGTGYFKYYRNNSTPGEGTFASTSPGSSKNQLDYDLTEVSVTTKYIAGYARIAKEFAQDIPFLSTFIPQELTEDFLRFESNEFAVNIQAVATAAASAGSNYAESIINNIAKLAKSDFAPNGIVLDPDGWANILKTKPNDYSVPGGVVISPAGDVMIAGVPVFTANWDGLAGKAMIGDWSQIWRIETEGLSLAVSEEEGNNFVKNQITYRLECREAITVRRTDAILYGSL